jgi:5-methylcytosine-specific restriction protein A
VSGGSRCDLHNKDMRAPANQRGYGYQWRKKRDAYLEKNPWCSDPFGDHPGQLVRATHVDHKVPLSEGGLDNESNYDGKCAHCHNKKTATQDGGFGNEKR